MGRLNSSVQIILSSTIVQSDTDQVVTYWDTFNLAVRFLLLNQTGVKQLSYNVTKQAQANVSNLNWAALPADVQSFLLSQSVPVIFNLTFSEWAWVDSDNAFANTTLFSLLPVNAQNCANNASVLISPLTFDLLIDITVLNQTLSAANPKNRHLKRRNLVNEFFESYFESVPQFSLFFGNKRDKRRSDKHMKNTHKGQSEISNQQQLTDHKEYDIRGKRKPTALSTFQFALKRAIQFLRSI